LFESGVVLLGIPILGLGAVINDQERNSALFPTKQKQSDRLGQGIFSFLVI